MTSKERNNNRKHVGQGLVAFGGVRAAGGALDWHDTSKAKKKFEKGAKVADRQSFRHASAAEAHSIHMYYGNRAPELYNLRQVAHHSSESGAMLERRSNLTNRAWRAEDKIFDHKLNVGQGIAIGAIGGTAWYLAHRNGKQVRVRNGRKK